MTRSARIATLAGALVATAVVAVSPARAHEIRPAYLEIKETAPDRIEVTWKTPVLAGQRLPIVLKLPSDVRNVKEPTIEELTDSLVERRWVDAGPGGLTGRRIEIVGLQLTITDVFVRLVRRDGSTTTELIHPSRPWLDIVAPRGTLQTAGVFFSQGVRHILLGADHLLFVLGLLLIVSTPWMLAKTITAFTVAHSITLAIATLGFASVPIPPLNAAIALSILFLGPEIVRTWRGETSFTIRHPWVVAFAFGLLHGFGFASGLMSMGLPQGEIAVALLSFNVGVEIGQLAFVAVILLMMRAFRTLEIVWPRAVAALPGYAVGSLGAFWTIQRVTMMLAGK